MQDNKNTKMIIVTDGEEWSVLDTKESYTEVWKITDKGYEEVQSSNMSKLDEDSKPIYNESGKVMKGPKYFKPDLTKFVNID